MSRLELALEDCLNRLTSGEATLEECLASYPEHTVELRRMLQAVETVEYGRSVSPSPAFKASTRARLLAYARSRPQVQAAERSWRWPWALGRALNLAGGVLAVVLLFLMTGTVLAQAALPGDALYGWRVTSERAWRLVHPNPLAVDLALSDRHARDLSRVVGDVTAEPVARQDYMQTLDDLDHYTAPQAQKIISQALARQKAELGQARVTVPELDHLLTELTTQKSSLALDHGVVAVESGRITYRLAVSNQGPDGPVTVVLADTLSPAETLVSTEGQARCTTTGQGRVSCTVDQLAVNQSRALTLTTAIQRCYTGAITNTATVAGLANVVNPNRQDRTETVVDPPFPPEARVVYVQSDSHNHNLGGVTSAGQSFDPKLPPHSAAPAWSPDGTQLAFFGQDGISESGSPYSQGNGLWVLDIVNGQGQNPRQLVALDHLHNIAWSPDGRRLAFEVGPPGQPHEVMVVDARSGQTVSRFPGEQPAWSPDSQQLVIKSCTPGCGLWLVNLDGSGGTPLTFGPTDSYAAWSPDGQSLVFSSDHDGNWEIYRLDLADGRLVRLTNRAGTDTTPVFGPCGQEIYLRTDHFGSWWITVMRLDGSDERKVREGVGSSDDWGLARPAVN